MKRRTISKRNKNWIFREVIKPLKRKGVRFDKIWFDSGYFIFEFQRNSVCKFKLRGIPEVLFGVWVESGHVELFGEDYVHIDKFKPSRCLNFTVDEISELYWDYRKGKITLREIVMDTFGNDDRMYWREEDEDRISPEEFDKVYHEQYSDELFKPSHGFFTREEFKKVESHLKHLLETFKGDDNFECIAVHEGLPFLHEYAEILVVYSDKAKDLGNEEFYKLRTDYRDLVIGKGKESTGIMFSYCDTREEFLESINKKESVRGWGSVTVIK